MNIFRSVFVLPLISATSAFAAAPEGWFIDAPNGFGTLMQTFSAHRYAGKRLRLTADVRAENVEGWAGVGPARPATPDKPRNLDFEAP